MPGSWVQAAEKGTVGFVGNLRGYGDMIILKHDQDYATVYTNVGELKVDKGDTVNKGDVLALVGKRPIGFQVRLKGKAIEDPSDWLEN
jgi:lipoprotein NlpD